MKRIKFKFTLLVLLPLLLTNCKKGVPEISSLRELEGFVLDQSSVPVSSKNTPRFSISGRCHPNFGNIVISPDGGEQWMPLSSIASTSSIDCQGSGKFSAEISFATKPLDISKWSATGIYNYLLFRGVSDLGVSPALKLVLNNQRGDLGRITPGGTTAPLTGGDFKIKGHVTPFSSSSTLSGGSYKLRGEVLW